MSEQPIRVLIADDHQIIRDGVRGMVQSRGWVVCGETGNGREAVALAEELRPSVAVLDLTMPELNGLDATRQILKVSPETGVLIFSGHQSEDVIRQVFEAGARSYIVKTDRREIILDAIEAVANQHSYFTPFVGDVIFASMLNRTKPATAEEQQGRLTSREREIVQLLAEGRSNKEVASLLGISVKTAETHRAAVMRKLGMQSFSHLVRYAIRNNLVSP
jgi:two-component system, NarL family, response regulator NreC